MLLTGLEGFPYEASGNKLLALLIEGARKVSLSDSLPSVYQLSAKPDRGYSNYHHKVTTYVDILSREARLISPESTAQQWKVVGNDDDPSSVFNFADTATARQNTADLARKLQNERVAIVGVGGTGSYVLDLIAKTWVREIFLFDDDPFLQHNAFRSPGSFSRAELEGGPIKSIFPRRKIFAYAQGHRPARHMHLTTPTSSNWAPSTQSSSAWTGIRSRLKSLRPAWPTTLCLSMWVWACTA